ncbi:MAG: type II secretion system protein GspF, partial [Halobacteriovoraceae bacterium]|nr:type II secretion system protein GspF [Halobacteriovoraceae bacterium]
MPIFSYKGLDKTGKEIKANINTENLALAKSKLKGAGIMLLDIKEQKSDGLKEKKVISFGKGISTDELSLMTRQLATLTKAKIQIVEALSALVEQSENPKLRIVLAETRQKVNEGSSLAEALGDYPSIFNNVYINMVEAGEASGTLEIVLLRLAEFTEAQVRLRNRIKGAMTYPVIMAIVGFIMMSIIFIFVIPKITKIFVTMKKKLPLQTEICIWISEFLQGYWWAVILAMFGSYYLFKKYIRTKSGESKWHRLLLHLPL